MFALLSNFKMIGFALVAISAIGGLKYVSDLKADLQVAQDNRVKLETALSSTQGALDNAIIDSGKVKESNKRVLQQLQDQAKALQNLQDKFNQSANGDPRDFGFIASRKPRLIERLINKGTANALRCVEIATGSPLTEKELVATTTSTANSECPQLANPNYIKVLP